MINVKSGIFIAGLAVIALVGFSKFNPFSRSSNNIPSSSVFTDRAKSQASQIRSNILNLRIKPFKEQINRDNALITSQTKVIHPFRGLACNSTHHGCRSGVGNTTARFLRGEIGFDQLSPAQKMAALATKERERNVALAHQKIQQASKRIEFNQKQISLIESGGI